jgi:hypothetical protein
MQIRWSVDDGVCRCRRVAMNVTLSCLNKSHFYTVILQVNRQHVANQPKLSGQHVAGVTAAIIALRSGDVGSARSRSCSTWLVEVLFAETIFWHGKCVAECAVWNLADETEADETDIHCEIWLTNCIGFYYIRGI